MWIQTFSDAPSLELGEAEVERKSIVSGKIHMRLPFSGLGLGI